MDEYSGKVIAEIMEGVINEDVTVAKKGSATVIKSVKILQLLNIKL